MTPTNACPMPVERVTFVITAQNQADVLARVVLLFHRLNVKIEWMHLARRRGTEMMNCRAKLPSVTMSPEVKGSRQSIIFFFPLPTRVTPDKGMKCLLRSGFRKTIRVRSGLKYRAKVLQVSTTLGMLFEASGCNALAKFQRVPNFGATLLTLSSVFLRKLVTPRFPEFKILSVRGAKAGADRGSARSRDGKSRRASVASGLFRRCRNGRRETCCGVECSFRYGECPQRRARVRDNGLSWSSCLGSNS